MPAAPSGSMELRCSLPATTRDCGARPEPKLPTMAVIVSSPGLKAAPFSSRLAAILWLESGSGRPGLGGQMCPSTRGGADWSVHRVSSLWRTPGK